jgi:hypothetical protein
MGLSKLLPFLGDGGSLAQAAKSARAPSTVDRKESTGTARAPASEATRRLVRKRSSCVVPDERSAPGGAVPSKAQARLGLSAPPTSRLNSKAKAFFGVDEIGKDASHLLAFGDAAAGVAGANAPAPARSRIDRSVGSAEWALRVEESFGRSLAAFACACPKVLVRLQLCELLEAAERNQVDFSSVPAFVERRVWEEKKLSRMTSL